MDEQQSVTGQQEVEHHPRELLHLRLLGEVVELVPDLGPGDHPSGPRGEELEQGKALE